MSAITKRISGLCRTIADFHRGIGRIARDDRGVSAVEFALILPVMITLYLGTVEISQGIAADRKVSLVARTGADLVSQVSTINNADMTNVLNATSIVMSPYSSANLKVTITNINIDANGKATVAWSDTLNGTARSVGSTVTLPTALVVPSSTLIWSEVSYSYKPTVGYLISGTLTLKDQIYMRPRKSDTITRTAT
jgi:Flp pilus assembly protein TadG